MLMTELPNCLVLPSIVCKLEMSTFWFLASQWRQRQSLQLCVEAEMTVRKLSAVANEIVYPVRIIVYDPVAHGPVVLSHRSWSENSEPGILLARLSVQWLLFPLSIPPW